MTDARITQCPKCDTTFRITPAQLKVAKGAVRCGACLHVFRASDHFQEQKPAQESKQDDRTADMFAGEPETPKQTPAQPTAPTPSPAKATEEPAVEPESSVLDEIGDTELIEDEDDFLIDDDNGLINDDPEEDQDKNTLGDLNEDFLSLDAHDPENPFYGEEIKHEESIKAENEDDESWAQALLNEPEDEPEPLKATPKKVKQPIQGDSDSGDILQNIENASAKGSANPLSQFGFIEEEPLDLALPEKKSKLPLLLWSLVSSLLIATLVGQLAYFNFDQWARYNEYRPYYQMACEQLGCTLPSSYDVSRIRTTASPQVSSHAKYKNALTVDILFMNDAKYSQAFPLLELSFSDSNDKVIAQRIFKPDEYLAGEAAGLELMPTHTPIHIALEIQDPGKSASNYQVRFLPPTI